MEHLSVSVHSFCAYFMQQEAHDSLLVLEYKYSVLNNQEADETPIKENLATPQHDLE